MSQPRLVPLPFPLRQQPGRRLEELAWRADKLREAYALGGKPFSDMAEANRIHAALGHAPVPVSEQPTFQVKSPVEPLEWLAPRAWDFPREDDRLARITARQADPGEGLDEFERHGAAQALALILFTLIGAITGGAIVWLFTRDWGMIL